MGYIQMANVKDVALEFKIGFVNKRYSLTPLYPKLQLEPDNKFRVSLGLSEWK